VSFPSVFFISGMDSTYQRLGLGLGLETRLETCFCWSQSRSQAYLHETSNLRKYGLVKLLKFNLFPVFCICRYGKTMKGGKWARSSIDVHRGSGDNIYLQNLENIKQNWQIFKSRVSNVQVSVLVSDFLMRSRYWLQSWSYNRSRHRGYGLDYITVRIY